MAKQSKDTIVTINGVNLNYRINPDHRNNNSKKSIWIVTEESELDRFTDSMNNNWFINSNSWAIYFLVDHIETLGRNKFNEYLKIAKFIENQSVWHGYPADYIRNKQDRPPQLILRQWGNLGYIKKHQVSNILRGRKCNL